MGATLDLADGAAWAGEAATKELEELREQIGAPTNPRYLLWRVWHGDNPSMRLWDYTAWMNKRWPEFCAEAKRNRHMLSEQDHADFDAWLRHWVRREIATTVTYADAF